MSSPKDPVQCPFDGFGTWKSDANEEWIAEARKYYINIVGKYGNSGTGTFEKKHPV